MRAPRATFLMAALVSAALPTSARAQRAEISQQLFTDQGLPYLQANPVPDGSLGRVLGFDACSSEGTGCVPLSGLRDRAYESPVDVPPGTVFRVRVQAKRTGKVTTDESSPWRGRVAALTPPALAGAARVGELVRPGAGGWTGGWGTESDVLGVEACPSMALSGCVTLGREGAEAPICRGGATVIGAQYRGWYLRATDERFAEDTAIAGTGYLLPEGIAPEPNVPIVSRSAFIGPIATQTGQFDECGRPRVSVIARPKPQRDVQVLGIVLCVSACDVQLIVDDGSRRIIRSVRPQGTRPLSRYAGSYSNAVGLPVGYRLRSDRVRVRIRVNGRTRAHGTVRVPRP